MSYFSFTLPRKTCQGKLASVYSRQVFLDKWTCQGKIARVNGALDFNLPFYSNGQFVNVPVLCRARPGKLVTGTSMSPVLFELLVNGVFNPR